MGTENRRERLLTILGSSDLISTLERHSPPGSEEEGTAISQRFEGFSQRLEAEHFLLPVAGVQGCGKSTLLNALLFQEPVLPIDADETTCVPAEVRYDPSPDGYATVEFASSPPRRVRANEDGLAAFLHNEHNPGNRLGVTRVVLGADHPMLRDGMVLVDLPGMGSLTKANLETTTAYLRQSVGVVFLLRTVPPLTRSEAVFVANTWTRLPLALFIQNRWSDETESEAKSGREHNESVLGQVAKRHRIPLDGPPDILVVNVFAAWRAALRKDASGAAASGSRAVESALAELGKSWPKTLERSVRSATLGVVDGALATIESRSADLGASIEEVKERIAEEEKRFAAYGKDLAQRRDEAKEMLRAFDKETARTLDSWSKTTRGALRNSMRTKLRAGIVDGPRLTRALRDEQQAPLDDAFGEFQERALGVVDDITTRFEGVEAWTPRASDTRRTIHLDESTKWEALTPKVVGAGGVMGGGKLGAMIGAAGGPPGIIIGAVIGGLIGGVLGDWLGKKTRDGVTAMRANAAMPEVKKAIDRFVKGTRDELTKQSTLLVSHLCSGLDCWLTAQENRYEHERERRMADLAADSTQRANAAATLRADRELLERYRSMLEKSP